MKDQKDYIRDIEEIRSMMERSTKFPSLSGWAGIMAGIYALAGAGIAHFVFHFTPDGTGNGSVDPGKLSSVVQNVSLLAVVVLILAVSTAIVLTNRTANKTGDKVWNAASRRLLVNLAIPLTTGGIFIVIVLFKGLIGLGAPLMLLFYGLALYGASTFTEDEVKFLGLFQMILGLISSFYMEYGLLFWAFGFGIVHIAYGIYMHFKYER